MDRRKHSERGSVFIEFAFCIALLWIPLFFGTYQIGFNLIRAMQVTQICRDAGHMYSQGTDFSQSSAQTLLKGLMPGYINTAATGNTAMYFTKVVFVDDAACSLVYSTPYSSTCPNYHKLVVTQQIPLGNTSYTSKIATPGSLCNSTNSYQIQPSDYLSNPAAIATGFPSAITLSNSATPPVAQFPAYVSEMYVNSPDLNFWSSLGTSMEYAKFVF